VKTAAQAPPAPGCVGDAYSLTGAAWDLGPRTIYRRLADVIVDLVPDGVGGRTVLDIGAGTGVIGESASERGAAGVVAVDVAIGILRVDAWRRPPAVVADALRLPFGDESFDAALAGFSFNHLTDPAEAFREAARVVRRGGVVCVAAYAAHDAHPVKAVVDEACRSFGWSTPAWYDAMRRDAIPLLATPSSALAHAAALPGAAASVVDVAFEGLDRAQLVTWRLGMAHIAPFVASLQPAERTALANEALARLPADTPPLVRSIVVVTWAKRR
jgi:SAM-dependent methyltransferase